MEPCPAITLVRWLWNHVIWLNRQVDQEKVLNQFTGRLSGAAVPGFLRVVRPMKRDSSLRYLNP